MPPNRPYEVQRELKACFTLLGIPLKQAASDAGLSYVYCIRILNGFAHSDRAIERLWNVVHTAQRARTGPATVR